MARSELGTQLRYTGFEAGSLQGEVNAGRLPSWQLPDGSKTGPGFIEQVVQTTFKSSGNHAIKLRINTLNGDTGCRIYHSSFSNNEIIIATDVMIPVNITSNRFYNVLQIKQEHANGSHLVFEINIRVRGGNNSGGPIQPVANFGQWHWGYQYNTDQPDPYPIQSGLNIVIGQWFRLKMRIKKNTFNGTTPNKDGRFEYWVNFNHAGGFPLVDDVIVNDYNNMYTNFYQNQRTGNTMLFNPTRYVASANNYGGSSVPSTTDVYLDNFGIYLPASDEPIVTTTTTTGPTTTTTTLAGQTTTTAGPTTTTTTLIPTSPEPPVEFLRIKKKIGIRNNIV